MLTLFLTLVITCGHRHHSPDPRGHAATCHVPRVHWQDCWWLLCLCLTRRRSTEAPWISPRSNQSQHSRQPNCGVFPFQGPYSFLQKWHVKMETNIFNAKKNRFHWWIHDHINSATLQWWCCLTRPLTSDNLHYIDFTRSTPCSFCLYSQISELVSNFLRFRNCWVVTTHCAHWSLAGNHFVMCCCSVIILRMFVWRLISHSSHELMPYEV